MEIFKSRKKTSIFGGVKYKSTEYQCPICKRWFTSYSGSYNTAGIKLHINRVAKKEAVEVMLGEIKRAPHFNFWKAHTVRIKSPNNRAWNI